jgi:hypothetical protein
MSTSNAALEPRLPLVRRNRRLLVHVRREMAEVDNALVDTFRRLAEGRAPWPLYLFGLAGSGKTSAALALADITRSAAYWTVEGLCSAVLESNPAEMNAAWEAIESKDLAVLDELGARERIGDLHYSAVKRFADAREIHGGRRAIYISNARPEQLVQLYDDRVISRLLCGTKFELTGRDRRVAR